MSDPANAIDVARYLVTLAAAEEEEDYLTHMQVQKLLYYVQGWSLVHRSGPMFRDSLAAWAYGPVAETVYHELKEFSGSTIPSDRGSDANLSEGQKRFIGEVWDAYKPYSAVALKKMTHDEEPWKRARGGLPAGERSNTEITHESMKEFFQALSDRESSEKAN